MISPYTYLCIPLVHTRMHACMHTGPCGALLHTWQLHAHVCHIRTAHAATTLQLGSP